MHKYVSNYPCTLYGDENVQIHSMTKQFQAEV